MNLAELRMIVARDMFEGQLDNQDLTPDALRRVLNQGYVDLVTQALPFYRTMTRSTVSGQATYDIYQDGIAWFETRYDTNATPLRQTSLAAMPMIAVAWQSTPAAVPYYAFPASGKQVALYPKPAAANKAITVSAFVAPYAAGGTIVTAVRGTFGDAHEVVITTEQPHKLAVDDVVQVYGVTPSGSLAFDDTSAVVTTVTTPNSFNYAQEGAADTGGVGGVVGYAGGWLPLYADGDTPDLPDLLHPALAHYAVWMLCSRMRLDNPSAQARGAAAKADYAALVAQAIAHYGNRGRFMPSA